MDRLPVELRLNIYGFVLHAEESLVQAKDIAHRAPPRERLDLALFLVSRQVFSEAQDAFYEVNTISIRRDIPAYSSLRLVRHLEFRNEHLVLAARDTVGFAAYYIGSFNKLPHLRTVTAASYIFDVHHKELLEEGVFTAMKVHATGLFKLEPRAALRGTIFFKNLELSSAIAQAKPLASLYTSPQSTMALLSMTADNNASESLPSKRAIRLAFWLRCYEGMKAVRRALPYASELQDADRACIQQFERGTLCSPAALHIIPNMPAVHHELPDDVLLTNISLANGHGSKLVEWASKILSYNYMLIVRAHG